MSKPQARVQIFQIVRGLDSEPYGGKLTFANQSQPLTCLCCILHNACAACIHLRDLQLRLNHPFLRRILDPLSSLFRVLLNPFSRKVEITKTKTRRVVPLISSTLVPLRGLAIILSNSISFFVEAAGEYTQPQCRSHLPPDETCQWPCPNPVPPPDR